MGTINTTPALFSKVQQRVLSLLLGQPGQSFYTNEIISLTNSGTGAVLRELKNLTSLGVLTIQNVGNQKRYQANPASPIYSELRSIVLKTFGLGDTISEALDEIKELIDFAFIYGSIAKQNDTIQSDIDLMVISDNLTYADIFARLERAITQLKRTINPTIYTREEWQRKLKMKNNFLIQVLAQPKIFLIGSEHGLNAISKFS